MAAFPARSFFLWLSALAVLAPVSLGAGAATDASRTILGATADVQVLVPVATMVENTSRTDFRYNATNATGGSNFATSPNDPSKCGTSTTSRSEFFVVDAQHDNLTFDEGNATRNGTSAGGAGAPLNASAETTAGCGEMGFRFTPAAGVTHFTVSFDAGRIVGRSSDAAFGTGTAKTPAANCAQELHSADDEGRVTAVFTLYDPGYNTPSLRHFDVPVQVSPGNASSNVTFYFADLGSDNPAPGALLGFQGAGAGVECIGWVTHVVVSIEAQPLPIGAVLSTNRTVVGADLREESLVAFDSPTYGDLVTTSSIRLSLAGSVNASYLVGPHGERIELSEVDSSETNGVRSITLPRSIVAQHGAGTYAIALTSLTAIPPAPSPPSLTIYPVIFALMVLPAVPGAFAARSTLRYRAAAVGRFQSTARAFLVALAAVVALYAAVIAYVLLAPRLDAMAVLPQTSEGFLLVVLLVLLAIGFATLWLVPSRFAMRAMVDTLEEQRRAEAKFRGLLETAPDAMVIVDKDGTIVLANAQAERMFGRPREALIGQPVETLMPARYRAAHVGHRGSFFGNARARGMDSGLELFGARADGREFPIEISLSPIETESGTLVTAAIRDITDRKKAQAELERSNRELEHFAYVASHDLQEPLRTIAGFTQLLESRYGDSLDEKGKSYVRRTVAGSQRMQSLINDLLAYSRIQTQGEAFAEVALDPHVNTLLLDLSALIERAGATVTKDLLPVVHADPSQIGQVFSNLIRNAVKYRHPDRAPRVHVGVKREGSAWLFSVSDNGIGIDPQYHEKIFVIFQRLGGRSDDGGTGLGLAITKRIVERHGGLIWVESVPDAGSTFFFSLPDHGAPSP